MPYIEVVAAILRKNGKLLIAKRKADKHAGGKWEFPGGKIEQGETPEEYLKRELFEEFGIAAHADGFFMESSFDYGDRQIRLLLYYATHISGEFEPRVHEEIKWVSKNELLDYEFANADIPAATKLSAKI